MPGKPGSNELEKLRAEADFWTRLPAYHKGSGRSKYDYDVPSDPVFLKLRMAEASFELVSYLHGLGKKHVKRIRELQKKIGG